MDEVVLQVGGGTLNIRSGEGIGERMEIILKIKVDKFLAMIEDMGKR
ncbi:MAG: hypothetical protein ANIMEMIM_00044 [Candidatus Argoarchaeum ethanivorans]|uniref:Uncharacterized protein n=1 Tax=Candidatus Argoarchaeum ethanivorans TaxID=2608793 RepID=A0A811TCP7_9EURY|nr:MAG: hypothetical protein ANIMEMIM_00044 [Candidatus Argoarchaeum ethanivorans]CAD6493432.1 MAG: hypothetical protein LAKADJCE_00508 [Candidatus Argoarchaeum ethanivorans]